MSELRVVLCTFPDAGEAERVGRQLVERRLAACVNLLPGVRSIYRWKEQVETDSEVLALIKTTLAALPALEAELNALHPYELPEFVALDPASVGQAYGAWIGESVNRQA